jgi:hypothetical protein
MRRNITTNLIVAEPNMIIKEGKCEDMIKEWLRLPMILRSAENLHTAIKNEFEREIL